MSYTMRPQFTMRKGDKEAFKKAALSVKSIQRGRGSAKSSRHVSTLFLFNDHASCADYCSSPSLCGTTGFLKGKLIGPRSRTSLTSTLGPFIEECVARLYKDFRSSVTRKERNFSNFESYRMNSGNRGILGILELEKFWNSWRIWEI